MGAPLTWRDVAAPDFSGAMRGYQIAGENITNAGKALDTGLTDWDTGRKDQASNALYQASMGYATPEALKAAQADGSLLARAGITDPSSITAGANQAIDTRVSNLLGQATSQQALVSGGMKNQVYKATMDAQIAAPGIVNKLNQNTIDLNSAEGSRKQTEFQNNQDALDSDVAAYGLGGKLAQGARTWADVVRNADAIPRTADFSDDDANDALVYAAKNLHMRNPNVTDIPTGMDVSPAVDPKLKQKSASFVDPRSSSDYTGVDSNGSGGGGAQGQGKNGAQSALTQATAPAPNMPASAPGDMMAARRKAIDSLESSGGNYSLVGPLTDAGDHAYGAHQVMGANIPSWTQKYYGQSLTPQQFLANPKAQDAVFDGEFGRLAGKYGDEGAARAWFAGEGGMNNLGATDATATSKGTSVADYGKRFSAAMAAGGNNEAVAGQYYGGLKKTSETTDRIGQSATQLNSSGLAQQYDRLTGLDPATNLMKNENDVDAVVKDLQTQNPNTWAKADAWDLRKKIQDIQAKSTTGGRGKTPVSAAVAAAIMTHADDAQSWKWLQPNTWNGNTVNTNPTTEGKDLDLATREGGLNQINQITKQYQNQAATLRAQQDAVSKSFKDLADAQTARSQGRVIPDSVLAQRNADFQAKSAALAKLHAAASSIQPERGPTAAQQALTAPAKPNFFSSGAAQRAYAQTQ